MPNEFKKITFLANSFLKHRPDFSGQLQEDEKDFIAKGDSITIQAIRPEKEKGHFYVTLCQDPGEKFTTVDGHNSVYIWADHVDYVAPDLNDPTVKAAASSYHISDEGIKLIEHYEGLELSQYVCSGNVSTIGIGTTRWFDGGKIRPGQRCTKKEAYELFRRDIKVFEQGVAEAITVPITQGQFDAAVSFSYNVGLGAFRSSTLLRKLNSGDYKAPAVEFMKWCRAGGRELYGLKMRRKSEVKLFYEGVYVPFN